MNKKTRKILLKIIIPIVFVLVALIVFSVYMLFFNKDEPYEIPEGSAEIHYIDVGQGDSTLIFADGATLLIDTGEADSDNTMINYLKEKEVETINYFIITHFDSDHFGEATEVLGEFKVENLIIPDQVKETKMYTTFMTAVAEKPEIEVSVIEGSDDIGDMIEVDNIIDIDSKADRVLNVGVVDPEKEGDKADLELEFFGPVSDTYSNSNDYSIIVMIRWGATKLLFTGDSESKGEADLVEKLGTSLEKELDCDVFKAGHHGSSTSSCDEILDAASPAYIIISCGEDNKYGHPHTEAIDRFNDKVSEDKIYRTDLKGTIVLTTDGETIQITTEK